MNGRGAPIHIYSPSPRFMELWNGSGMSRITNKVSKIAKEKVKLGTKMRVRKVKNLYAV